MAATNYKSFWDDKASDTTGALIAVDGSANEDIARLTGAYSARQASLALDIAAGDRVLELGCGVGRIGREIAPNVAHWEGTDISANMLGVARERLKDFGNVGLTELKRSSLDAFPDASFDKAYCIAVFIHMDKEDFFLYLEEVARVLKPGGLFYFDVWNLASDAGWRRFELELNQQRRNGDPSQRKDVARNQFSTLEEVRIFLARCGLEHLQSFSDSPWIQTVAMKPGGHRDAAAERRRIAAIAPRIVYTQLWSDLFDAIVRMIGQGLPPQSLLDVIEAKEHRNEEEIPMFRAWLQGFWKHNEQQWGPPPASLG